MEINDYNDFIVNSDLKLENILRDEEVMPLLRDILCAGSSLAMITATEGKVLWTAGPDSADSHVVKKSLTIEGKTAGYLTIKGEKPLEDIARITGNALNLLVQTNLKSRLTSEVDLLVLNQSNAELLEINKQLATSEKKYRDLSEHLEEKVKERTNELRQVHTRLLQQEKMASIGQLAAGIAHEINNPMGFVMSNLNTLKTYMARSREILEMCRLAAESGKVVPEFADTFSEQWKRFKMDAVISDADDLIHESLDGAERVKHIVSNLRVISHIDEDETGMIDINEELGIILNLLNQEVPSGANIVKEFSPLPKLTCNPGLMSQGFFNIILNALQSRKDGLEVVVTTLCSDNQIIIRIADNGPGIPDAIIGRVFDPFFTTKEVGKGTGLGLSIVYDIITSHGGTIEVQGRNGATFEIKLPIKDQMQAMQIYSDLH
jgi:two-component system, NtrC family, sensor kinase